MDIIQDKVLLSASAPPGVTVCREELREVQEPDAGDTEEWSCIMAEDVHKIQVGPSADGMPDEIMAVGVYVHLERMDEHTWWMKIEQDNCRSILWFHGVEEVSTERNCGDFLG